MSVFTLRCLRCGFHDGGRGILFCPQCKLALAAQIKGTGPDCNECKLKAGRRQIYTVSDDKHGTFTWNVSLARVLVEGAPLRPISHEVLSHYLQVNQTDPRHYEHIEGEPHGILAPINMQNHAIPMLYAMIDGNHRAARAIIHNQPFFVHVMTEHQSSLCLLGYEPPSILKSKKRDH